jgi:acyl-CoA thioesterase I
MHAHDQSLRQTDVLMSQSLDDLMRFKYPLPHLTHGLNSQRKVRIVAIGSSSTAGEGGIVPYPGRLELALRDRFRGPMIDVLNRGIGGQEALDELSRFDPDVIDETPALVIWQVGTNAVFRNQDYNFEAVVGAITAGLERLANLPMDVVLMDLQYATAIVKPEKIKLAEDMVSRISAVAGSAHVNVFHRFALMRQWCDDHIAIANLIDPADGDRLHMSEWCTSCITQVLDTAIAGAPPPTA